MCHARAGNCDRTRDQIRKALKALTVWTEIDRRLDSDPKLPRVLSVPSRRTHAVSTKWGTVATRRSPCLITLNEPACPVVMVRLVNALRLATR